MGNDTGFYIGPYIKFNGLINDQFDCWDAIDTLVLRRYSDSNVPVFIAGDSFFGSQRDYCGWDDCGEYALKIDAEMETQSFAKEFERELCTLRENYREVEIKWGVVVWGEF